MLSWLKEKARMYSPWIYHFHAGGCNGCDIETFATLIPRFDIERFGVKLVNSSRHADIIIINGPITKQFVPMLLRVYNQVPNPKVVIAIGSCALTCGVFNRNGEENYALAGPAEKIIPVDVCVPGCPPKPEAIIQGVIFAIKKLSSKK